MDTESPVVWPAWCYSGETTTTSEALEALQNVKSLRKKRMDRTTSNNNGLISTAVALSADYGLHNNNNNVKNERLSPSTPDTSTRSRSVTPSSGSHPDTPPASMENSLISGRNYSDFMRSLAAKYNHANPNDYFAAVRNGFPPPLDVRFKSVAAPMGFPSNLLSGFSVSPCKETASVGDLSTKKPAGVTPDISSVISPFAGSPASIFPPLIDMSTTQTLLAMVRTAKEVELQGILKNVKRQDTSSPLDLSSGAPPAKRQRTKTPSVCSPTQTSTTSTNAQPKRPESESPKLHEDISNWTVDDVCNFVQGIDICAEYAQTFREQRIDGSGLPLLTEDHLTNRMGMKLGPALKLRSFLAKKLGSCSVCLHCTHCHTSNTPVGQSPEVGNNTGNSSDSGGVS